MNNLFVDTPIKGFAPCEKHIPSIRQASRHDYVCTITKERSLSNAPNCFKMQNLSELNWGEIVQSIRCTVLNCMKFITKYFLDLCNSLRAHIPKFFWGW